MTVCAIVLFPTGTSAPGGQAPDLAWHFCVTGSEPSRQYLLSTCCLGAPGVGCGHAGGNQADKSLSSVADSNTEASSLSHYLGLQRRGKSGRREDPPRSGPLPFIKPLQVLHQVSGLPSGSFHPALFKALLQPDGPFSSSSPLSQATLQWRDPQRLPLAPRRKPTSWSRLLCAL